MQKEFATLFTIGTFELRRHVILQFPKTQVSEQLAMFLSETARPIRTVGKIIFG
jgi:hypothetical protein